MNRKAKAKYEKILEQPGSIFLAEARKDIEN